MNFLKTLFLTIKRISTVVLLISVVIGGGWLLTQYDASKAPPLASKQLLVEGENALNIGHYNDAEKIFLDELKANPQNEAAQWGLQIVQLQKSITQPEFKTNIDEIYQQNLSNPHLNLLLGKFYLKAGDADTALPYYQEALSQNPKLADAYSDLALYYEQQSDYETAKVTMLEAIDSAPIPRYRNDLGRIYFKQKRFEEAIKEYGKNKEYPLSALESGRIYWRLEYLSQASNYQYQAIEWLNDKAIMSKPENQEAWHFDISPQKSVELSTVEEKKIYAYYCLSISLYLQGDKVGAEHELQKLSALNLTRSANMASLLGLALDALARSNNSFTDQVIAYKQLFL